MDAVDRVHMQNRRGRSPVPSSICLVAHCMRGTRTHLPHPPPWPGHPFPLQLHLTACSWCTGVPVHTFCILLFGRPMVPFPAQSDCLFIVPGHEKRLPIFNSDRVGADFGGVGEIGERIP